MTFCVIGPEYYVMLSWPKRPESPHYEGPLLRSANVVLENGSTVVATPTGGSSTIFIENNRNCNVPGIHIPRTRLGVYDRQERPGSPARTIIRQSEASFDKLPEIADTYNVFGNGVAPLLLMLAGGAICPDQGYPVATLSANLISGTVINYSGARRGVSLEMAPEYVNRTRLFIGDLWRGNGNVNDPTFGIDAPCMPQSAFDKLSADMQLGV
jgi:hypothetical protein